MGGDQCQKYLFLVESKPTFDSTFFWSYSYLNVTFKFEHHVTFKFEGHMHI